MVLGLENLTPEGLASLGLDLGPLLLVFAAFSLVVGTFQSIAYSVQSEAALGTLEHLGLALRGGPAEGPRPEERRVGKESS